MRIKNQIKYELMKRMAIDSYASSFAILTINSVIAFLFWNEANRISLSLWMFFLCTIFIARNIFVTKFLQNRIDFEKIYKIFIFLTFLSALIISSGFIFLFLHADYLHQIFIIFVIAGTSAGAVLSLSYFKNLSISYLSILLLPLIYLLARENLSAFYTLSLLIMLFLIMLSIFAIKNNKNIITTLIAKNKILLTKEALEVSKNNFETIFRELPIGLFTYNKNLLLTQANKALSDILHLDAKQLENLDLKMLKDASFITPLQKVFNNEEVSHNGTYHTTLSDLKLYLRLHAIPMYDAKGNIISGLAMIEDITQQIHYQKQLEYQAFYDSLTGLENKVAFQNHLKQFIKKLQRSEEYGILLFIDLDDFKNINDSLGHNIGDYILQIFSQRVKKILRKEDVFARLGGDEFVILLAQTNASPAQINEIALHVSKKVHTSLKKPIQSGENMLYISLSIGVKILSPHENSITTIFKHADIAMYESKKTGKNKTSFYDSSMSTQIQNQLLLHNELQIAIKEEQFELYLQPIVHLKTDKIVSAEALIRWNHPQKGLTFPDTFIEYAESSNLIIDIGNWVIQRACQIYNELNEELEDIAINISLKQFSQENFEEILLANTRKYNVDPHCIKLELTESITLNDLEKTIQKMLLIKKHGFKFSMDDFGTGYSSLSYLKNLPFDYLKIDQSFVRDMLEDENDKKLIKIIIDVAQQFNFLVIAEGIETAEHVEFIKSHACDYYQGYFMSKPVSLEDFIKLISFHNSKL